MQLVYDDDCVDASTMRRRWTNRCKDGEAVKCDKQNVGRHVTATDEFHKEWVDELTRENQRTTQTEIAVKIVISQERVGHIIDIRGYRKICARWARRMFMAVSLSSKFK
jgi:hypothetical protein